MLLLILSGTACTVEVQGEDQIIAVQAQNLTPVQMGNIRQSDILAGLLQGNLNYHDLPDLVKKSLLKINLLVLPCLFILFVKLSKSLVIVPPWGGLTGLC